MPKGTTPDAHKGDAALQAGIPARKERWKTKLCILMPDQVTPYCKKPRSAQLRVKCRCWRRLGAILPLLVVCCWSFFFNHRGFVYFDICVFVCLCICVSICCICIFVYLCNYVFLFVYWRHLTSYMLLPIFFNASRMTLRNSCCQTLNCIPRQWLGVLVDRTE